MISHTKTRSHEERNVVLLASCLLCEICLLLRCLLSRTFQHGIRVTIRRIATRHEETARDFLAMINLACAMVRLR